MILGRGMEITPRSDIPVVIAMLMDKAGLTEFSFSIPEMLEFTGEIDMDYNIDTYSYLVRRTKADVTPAPDVIVKVGKTTSELSPRELRRARYGGPRGGSPWIGRE